MTNMENAAEWFLTMDDINSSEYDDPTPTVAMDPCGGGWNVGEIENSTLVRTIYGFIAVIGITGNFLVCLVLLRVPSLRSNTSSFLVHLSVVDLIACIWVIPFHLFPHTPTHSGVGGEIKCRLYSSKFPLWTTLLVSICCLVTVNLERFIAIIYPTRYKSAFSRRNIWLLIAAAWAIGIISNTYAFYTYASDGNGNCVFLGFPTVGLQVVLGLYNITAYYLGPFLFMVYTQWRVIKTLKVQGTALKRTGSMKQSKSESRKMWQLHAARELENTLIVVSITYAACWAPNQLLFLIFNLGPDCTVDFQAVYYHVTVILAVANSCLNPIIYTMKNRPFRRGLAKMFGFGAARGSREVQPRAESAGRQGVCNGTYDGRCNTEFGGPLGPRGSAFEVSETAVTVDAIHSLY